MPYLFIYRLYFYGVDLIQLRGNENTHNPDLVQLIQLQILMAVTVVLVQDLNRLKKRLVLTFET